MTLMKQSPTHQIHFGFCVALQREDKRGGLQMVGGGGEAADGGLINRETNGTWKKEMRKKEHFDQVKI